MKLCLGTVQFGLPYGVQENGQPDQEEVNEMLDYAIAQDIRVIDTAAVYGTAEDVLGSYFSNNGENINKVKIISKLPPNAFEKSPINGWKRIAVEAAKKSRRRIGIDHLYAYLFHNASYIFNEDAVQALDEVKRSGIAKHIGVSIYTPEEALKALSYQEIDIIQIPYNIFDRRLDRVNFFNEAKKRGVEIYARSALLQGLVVMNPQELPEKVKFAKRTINRFREICEQFNTSPFEMAIGYVRRKYGIDYIVFGTDNLSQLKDFISVGNSRWGGVSEEMIEMIDVEFSDVEERIVNPTLWR